MKPMTRETFRCEEDDMDDIEELVEKKIYSNKSEALRDGVKMVLDKYEHRLDKDESETKPWSRLEWD